MGAPEGVGDDPLRPDRRVAGDRAAGHAPSRAGPALAEHAEASRTDYNTVRPHQALAWNRPLEVCLGPADPAVPNFPDRKSCQLLDGDNLSRRASSYPCRSSDGLPAAAPARADLRW